MPKGRRKGKFEHRRTEQPSSSDEDAGICMINDNCSETSTQSDLKSNQDEGDNELQEKFEEKVMETIEALNAKSNAARALAFTSLTAALQRRPLSHLLTNHRATLADHVTRSLRRGKGAERKAAAATAPILSLQIGEDNIEEFVQEVRPALMATAIDKSATIDTRTECCSSLAVLCYLAEDDITVILEIMRMYETIFSGSYLKGDGTVKVSGVALEEGPLHAAAMDSWNLMFTLLPRDVAVQTIINLPPTVDKLTELLQACTLEVRLAAGGALAVVHECVTDIETGECPIENEIEAALPCLEQLSTESHKYRAKKDRKIQRATFRDILKYFEDDIIPVVSARCGSETVSCDTWSCRGAYGALAATLGTGLHTLLATSSTLRDALRLPPPAHLQLPKTKMNKLQRHLQNAAAFKARTLARNKSRDKRSAALAL